MPSPISAHRKGFNASSERGGGSAETASITLSLHLNSKSGMKDICADDLSAITPVTAAQANGPVLVILT